MVLINKKRTPPLKHRKRIGQHHKRGKSYEKHYWPYLPLLAIAGMGFVLNIFWTPLSQSLQYRDVLSYATSTGMDGLLIATNQQRSENGQSNLTLNSQLIAAAQAKANDMAARNYWSHNTPDGLEPWYFITNAGYSYQAVGENLAYGFDNSAATVTGWMNSPGHRANILNTNYQEIGFGVANAADYQSHGNQTIVVAMYGKPLNNVAAAAPIPPSAIPPAVAPAATAPAAVPAQTPASQQTPAPTAEAAPAQSQPIPAEDQRVLRAPGGQPVTIPASQRDVSRLQLVGNNVPTWSITLSTIIVLSAAAVFIYRHLRYLHRILVKGEHYALKHPAFDMVLVLLLVIGVLLTRVAGNIQ